MKITPITPEDLGRRLRVSDGSLVRPAGAADLAREAAGRWGLVREAQLRRWLADTLCTVGIEKVAAAEASASALEALVALRELEPVVVDATPPESDDEDEDGDEVEEGAEAKLAIRGGAHLAPALPRVVDLAEKSLVIGDVVAGQAERAGPARWVSPDEAARLRDEGAGAWGPEDWMGMPGWYPHAERRGVQERDPGALWRALLELSERVGSPVSDPEGMWVIAGRPGGYFGKPGERGGRWVPLAEAPDGSWCGVAPGYNDRHWRPVLLQIAAGSIRLTPLWDTDDLRWALVSRGAEEGAPELLRLRGGELRVTFPMPAQLWRLRHLCGGGEGWVRSPPPGLRRAELLSPSGVALQ
jgi:hypothetical protein